MLKKLFSSYYVYVFLLAFFVALVTLNFFLDFPNRDTTYFTIARDIEFNQVTSEALASTVMVRVLTSPALVYLPLFLTRAFGGFDFASFNLSLLLLNLPFYFLAIFFFYSLVNLIYQNRRVALIGSFLFFSNYAMIYFGLNAGADMSGWMFYLASTYFAVKYYFQHDQKKYFLAAIFISSIGMFFKEYAILGVLALGTLILIYPEPFKKKLVKLILAGGLFLLLPGSYHLYYYFKNGFDYSSFYNSCAVLDRYNLVLLIKVMGSLYTIGWLYLLLGLCREWRERNVKRLSVLLGLAPAAFGFLGWPCLLQRVAFVCIPLLAMISGFGLAKIKQNWLIIILLIVYALMQFYMKDILL